MGIVMEKSTKRRSYTVALGDSAKLISTLEPKSIHAVITDPPY